MEIEALTRKWGNSIAVIIPAKIAERERIKENEHVVIKVERKKPKAGVLFGLLKGKIAQSTQEIKDELRAGWLSDSDREREAQWEQKRKQKP